MPTFLSAPLASKAAVEGKTVPDFTKNLLVELQLVHTSVMGLDQQNELLLDDLVCHVARKFLIWYCGPYRQVFRITELWSEYRNVSFRIIWRLNSADK